MFSKTNTYDVYMLKGCPFCTSVVDDANSKNIKIKKHYIGSIYDEDKKQKISDCVIKLKKNNKFISNTRTVPIVVKNGIYVGDSKSFKNL